MTGHSHRRRTPKAGVRRSKRPMLGVQAVVFGETAETTNRSAQFGDETVLGKYSEYPK